MARTILENAPTQSPFHFVPLLHVSGPESAGTRRAHAAHSQGHGSHGAAQHGPLQISQSRIISPIPFPNPLWLVRWGWCLFEEKPWPCEFTQSLKDKVEIRRQVSWLMV